MASKRTSPEPGSTGYPGSAGETGGASVPQETAPASAGGASGPEPVMTAGSVAAMEAEPAPSLAPDGSAIASVGALQNGKKVSSLYASANSRNAYAGIEGVGWKRLSTRSENIALALTMLASHAREKGSTVNFREEADGMVYELYVF